MEGEENRPLDTFYDPPLESGVTIQRGSQAARRVTTEDLQDLASVEEVTEEIVLPEIQDSMSSDDDSVKSHKGSYSKVPSFKEKDDWDMFEHKFMAYADDKGFVDMLAQPPDLPTSFDGNMNFVTDKKQRKLLKMNRKAVNALSHPWPQTKWCSVILRMGKQGHSHQV
jgi:hypothetical protein